MGNNATVSQQFGRASLTYDQHANIQREMAMELMIRMDQLSIHHVNRILEIGCGTGYLTGQLLSSFPKASILAVDISQRMVNQAQTRWGDRVTFKVCDAEVVNWEKEGPFDLIVSNATVQWFSQPNQTFTKLVRGISPGGWLIASTFGPGTFKELHTLFREVEVERGLPIVRHGLELHGSEEWQQRMEQAAFTSVQSNAYNYPFYYKNAREFVRAIRGMGATHSEFNHSSIMAGRLLSEVLKRYDCRYSITDGVSATFEAVWMWGQRV
ncbi:malonyl-ACP O-methyltransferase BioC [Marininema halotolerans]|uniref:Malonyl-[acyl-carrier protein] O-methyltransferase n=1 Tax=Marininema halotolerans TaxID=1155944 RepID=A0A1I6NT47_9BACL|nr:malonyl-ACP O-methyltransferase BioC [Marininema halotolerans]SFS31028.1 malonyl-CoA O-methyltransferase [Marininema halotolerans]